MWEGKEEPRCTEGQAGCNLPLEYQCPPKVVIDLEKGKKEIKIKKKSSIPLAKPRLEDKEKKSVGFADAPMYGTRLLR